MALEDLYREVVLDHYRNPRNRKPLDRVDAHAEGDNPLCGDRIELDLTLDGDRVSGVSVRGQGCSISQSSASMMSQAVEGRSVQEIQALAERFKRMMTSDDQAPIDPEEPGRYLGDLEALHGVRRYPVRIKCALLGWETLDLALTQTTD